jgi:plastocyanin
MPYRRFKVLALILAVPFLAALPSRAATVNVSVGGPGFSFTPQEVHIHPGDTVTWTNAGGAHNVAADDGSFRNALSSSSWTFSHTFAAVGRAGYHCEAHGAPGSGMFGTVVVENAGGGGGGPVKAPSNLRATASSTSQIDLAWTDNATNETGFQIERRTVGGAYEVVATVGPNTTNAPVGGLDPGSFSLFRVRATGAGNTFSPYSPEASAATLADPGPCVPGPTVLCLNNGRFRATIDWRTAADNGHGFAVPLPSAPDSGLFYFFSPTNIEMLIKVLNACVAPFNHYWVFFAATTNVELAVVVTDTANGKTVAYFNPLNRAAAPVQDINAFATCP